MSFYNFGPRTIRTGGLAFIGAPKVGLRVINETGSAITAGKVVALSGFDVTSGRPNVVLADADTAAHEDLYVTTAAIADTAEGYVYKGALSAADIDTNSATTVGDAVYLSTTAGGFLHAAPVIGGQRVRPVGFVAVKSATVGQIFWKIEPPVRGIGRMTLVAGQDETGDTTITVTGMVAGDEVEQVLVVTTAASIASAAARAIADFSVGAGVLNIVANAANNTNNQYWISWRDLT